MSGLTNTFIAGLCARLRAPNNPNTQAFFHAWQIAEGGTALHNPFNTEQSYPLATNYNAVGVKNYPSESAGIDATASTLLNGHYGLLVNAIRAGYNALDMAQGVAQSPWGTGAGVLAVLHREGYAPIVNRQTLKVGSTGTDVVYCQRRLIAFGAKLVADGFYGPITQAAVKSFQVKQRIAPDGIVGPITWSKLG